MFVKVDQLPTSLQSALSRLGYGRKDVEINAAATVSPLGGGMTGRRAFFCVVNLDTGEASTKYGSWGGSNMFVQNQVDSDDSSHPIPLNGAAIKGMEGYGTTSAAIYVNPDNLTKLLPATTNTELTIAQGVVLHCLKGYKSFARRDEASSYGVDTKAYDQAVSELAAKGWAKVSSNGATQITTEGKNALSGFKLPKGRYGY